MIAALRSALVSSNDSHSLAKWNDELDRKLFLQQHDDGHAGCPPPFDDEKLDDTHTTTIRIVANELHLSILKTVYNVIHDCYTSSSLSLLIIESIYNYDVDADKVTCEIVDNIQLCLININSATTTMITSIYWKHLAILLRATGLFMRWITQNASTSSVLSFMTSIGRLKSKGMLSMYSKLLDLDILTSSSTETDSKLLDLDILTLSSTETDEMDVPRLASICLFRATYGNDTLTVVARQTFVDSLDGCACLMRALLRGDQPVSRLFSVVRNIHHLISTCPESITKMEHSLMTWMESAEGSKCYLTELIVATMAWACRSEPPFSNASVDDRRPELILEILRTMYALHGRTSPSNETMTHIGILLCELLRYSSADTRLYEIKLAVVSLLLNAPTEYSTYLLANGGIEPLVDILSYQSSLVVVEKTGSSTNDAAAIIPILLTLLRLVESNELVLKVVTDAVFPPDSEATFEQLSADVMGNTAAQSKGGKVNAKNMAPLDAPKGTLRWKLICLMTWTESNVKRAACELLWALCDGNATRFVLRTGFGNAVYFLGIKGCVSLPASVEM